MTRRLGLLVTLLALLLVYAPSASATAEATFENCTPLIDYASSWNQFDGGSAISLDDYCATGDGLQIHNNGSGFGQEAGWAFYAAGTAVVSYSFEIEGGDTSTGIQYATRACDGCAADRVIGERSDSSPTEHIAVDAPSSGEGIIIYAKCVNPDGCDATTSELRISNLMVTVSDSIAPDLMAQITSYPSYPGELIGWTNKKLLPVQMSASDSGFGIISTSVTLSGGSETLANWDFSSQCNDPYTLTSTTVCPPVVYPTGFADFGDLTDGVYELVFSATDAAENVASVSPGRIGLDRTAPGPPGSPALEFTPSGWPGQRWTSDPTVTLSWGAPPEISDPEVESLIHAQRLSVGRDGSPPVHQAVVPMYQQSSEFTLLSDGEWDASVLFEDSAGNLGFPARRTVGLDVDAPNAPTNLTVDDWYSKHEIAARPRLSWDAPTDKPSLESGVCGYVLRIDSEPESAPVWRQDDSTIGTSWPLPAGLPDGPNYFHIRAVSCAGVVSTAETIALNIDTTAPQITVTGVAGSGSWSSQPQQAAISATDSGSGVEAVGYAIDSGPVSWTSGDITTVELPEGSHILKSYARDVAGNVHKLETTANTDTQVPNIELATATVSDPALSGARVQDVDSGLAALAIELRRVDQGAASIEREWKAIGGAEPISSGDRDVVEISRRIDDAQLEPGDYELRVNARDIAGNSSADGSFAIRSMRLPLRRPAELSIGVADIVKACRTASGKSCKSVRKCPAKARCRTVRVVDRSNAKASVVHSWSSKSAVVGDALDSGGAPLVGVNVTISATAPFHEPEPLGSVQTDSAGRYELRLPERPSSTLTARIEGGPTQQPGIATANRIVRSQLEFTPAPRLVRAGRTVRLAGRVLHDDWLPVGGVAVSFQWYSPTGWATFANPVQSDADGRFSRTYKWSAAAKRGAVRLRARVEQPNGWPFAPGSSDSTRIQVLPAR